MYVDENLATIPDINVTGRDFYTFWFRADVDLSSTLEAAASGDGPCAGIEPTLMLIFRGANYAIEVRSLICAITKLHYYFTTLDCANQRFTSTAH